MLLESFPGDPRYAKAYQVDKEDIERLGEKKMLSTRLIDLLLTRALRRDCETSNEGRRICCANTLCKAYFDTSVKYSMQYHSHKKYVDRLRAKMKTIMGEGRFTLIFPHVQHMHFLTIKMNVDIGSKVQYNSPEIFDSTRRSSRSTTFSHTSSVGSMLKSIAAFLNHYLFYDKQSSRIDINDLISKAKIRPTPQQQNGIDCGLFAVGTTLGLVEGKNLDTFSFSQEDVTRLRKNLHYHLMKEYNDLDLQVPKTRYIMNRDVIRSSFSFLEQDEQDLDCEIIGLSPGTIVKEEMKEDSKPSSYFAGINGFGSGVVLILKREKNCF